jgi:capsular polysaccharide transport system permease protein
MIRAGYFGNVIRTHFDWAYMFQATLVLTLVGLLVTRDAARRVEAR